MMVTLPVKNIDGFTLYADGALLQSLFIEENKHALFFDNKYVLFLFYTYPHHRRVYMVSVDKTNILPKTNLPCVNRAVSILYKARGKKIDMLKNALFLLRKLPYWTFPILFYQKLVCIIETNKKLPRFIINQLLNEFNLGVI